MISLLNIAATESSWIYTHSK